MTLPPASQGLRKNGGKEDQGSAGAASTEAWRAVLSGIPTLSTPRGCLAHGNGSVKVLYCVEEGRKTVDCQLVSSYGLCLQVLPHFTFSTTLQVAIAGPSYR